MTASATALDGLEQELVAALDAPRVSAVTTCAASTGRRVVASASVPDLVVYSRTTAEVVAVVD
jgi:hypothetical protein